MTNEELVETQKELKLTVKNLANISGYTTRALYNYRSGKARVPKLMKTYLELLLKLRKLIELHI